MPTFCRHNRFAHNCPICRAADVSTSPAPRTTTRPRRPRPTGSGRALSVRRDQRSADDGYRTSLAPGLRASADASRLADELAFAAGRLAQLRSSPPGLYAEVASEPNLEEALWLAFLIAYLCPLDAGEPFAAIAAVRTSWRSGETPALDGVAVGPRSAHEADRGSATLLAYRAWVKRAGSQALALTGEPHWTAQRRFARSFERLALPGMHRAARFELLAGLGTLGRLDVRADSLFLSGAGDDSALGAKRALGIADPLLLDRRATALANACSLPLEALDLALCNWQRREPARMGARVDADDSKIRARARAALEV